MLRQFKNTSMKGFEFILSFTKKTSDKMMQISVFLYYYHWFSYLC